MANELTILIDLQSLSELRAMDQGVTVAAKGEVLQTLDQPLTDNLVTLDESALGPNGAFEVYLSQGGQQAGRLCPFDFAPSQTAMTLRYDDDGGFEAG